MECCHHCNSMEFRKNGTHEGVQRYFCNGCRRTFTSRGERFSKEIKEKALEMYVNNVGIRKIAKFVGASPAGVLKWIRAAHVRISKQLKDAAQLMEEQKPDIIEMDEIYTFVQKNIKGQSYGLLIVDKKVALLPIALERALKQR